MNKNLTLIDADSLAYICGNTETLEEAIKKVDERIDNIVRNTNANYISLFISKGKYFRHQIYPEYKSQRTQQPPKWMRSIKSYLEDKYEANWMANVEADDLVSYWMNRKIYFHPTRMSDDPKYPTVELEANLSLDTYTYSSKTKAEDINITMSAIDKDLLYSIPGKHWNFTYKSEDSKVTEGYWVETRPSEASLFRKSQMIIGDPGDGVKGIEELGKSAWERMVSHGTTNMIDILLRYDAKYGEAKGIFEFQNNYRLLHMLENDEDFIREVGEVPKFPNIIKIKEDVKEDIF